MSAKLTLLKLLPAHSDCAYFAGGGEAKSVCRNHDSPQRRLHGAKKILNSPTGETATVTSSRKPFFRKSGEAPFRQLCSAYPSLGGRQREAFDNASSAFNSTAARLQLQLLASAFSEARLPFERPETNPAVQKDSSSLAELYEYNNFARARQL